MLVGTLFFINYQKKITTLEQTIFTDMRLCSFDLQCPKYKIDFSPIQNQEVYKLYKENLTLHAYFPISQSSQNYLIISLSKIEYDKKIYLLKETSIINFLFITLVLIVLSLLFSLYALYPLKNALHLTDEFVKDILHDFNTPLSTLRLNISMLKKQFGENSKINRIENSIQHILNLQSNLRAYLGNNVVQNDTFNLQECIQERVSLIEKSYPKLTFLTDLQNIKLYTNKDAFSRIIDNIVSNAAKYNKTNGIIKIILNKKIIEIEDTGIGIKNVSKVFDRFYKENDRGVGIGLHIVKKLCEELKINIYLNSQMDIGTIFYLDIKHIISKK